MSYNKIILQGRLTREPELRRTQAGLAVTSFTLAVDRPKGKSGVQATDFIDCVAWDKTAEFAAKYFAKGQLVLVDGALQSRAWQDKQGQNRISWEVQVQQARFSSAAPTSARADGRLAPPPLTSGRAGEGPASLARAAGQPGGIPVDAADFVDADDDGELPF